MENFLDATNGFSFGARFLVESAEPSNPNSVLPPHVPGTCPKVDGEDENSLWYVGVLLSIFASAASNLGVNVQKFSQNKEQERVELTGDQRRSYLAQPIWFLGLGLVIFGSVGDFIALGFAAQSLIIPVGGSTMIFNIGFAHFWLKEHITKKDLFATGLLLSGVLIITIFAPKDSQCFTASELLDLYYEPLFIVYIILFTIAFSTLHISGRRLLYLRSTYGTADPRYTKYQKLHRFIYPSMSGLIGAQDVLFAKSTAELIKVSVNGDNQFVHFLPYVVIVLMVVCILMQLHFLAVGLQFFDAVYVVPLFQCFFISGSIVSGAIYFKEFRLLSASQLFGFAIGAVTIIAGVFFLSQRKAALDDSKGYKHDFFTIHPKRRFRSAVFAVIYVLRRRKEGDHTKSLVDAMRNAWANKIIRNGLDVFDPEFVALGIPLPRVIIRKRQSPVIYQGYLGENSSLRDHWRVSEYKDISNMNEKQRHLKIEFARMKAAQALPPYSRIFLWLTHKSMRCVGKIFDLGGTTMFDQITKHSPFVLRSGGLTVVPDFGTGVLAMSGDVNTNYESGVDSDRGNGSFLSTLGPGPGWGWLSSQLLRQTQDSVDDASSNSTFDEHATFTNSAKKDKLQIRLSERMETPLGHKRPTPQFVNAFSRSNNFVQVAVATPLGAGGDIIEDSESEICIDAKNKVPLTSSNPRNNVQISELTGSVDFGELHRNLGRSMSLRSTRSTDNIDGNNVNEVSL